MATLTASPSEPLVGQAVLLTGEGFTDGGTVTVSVTEEGFESQVVADASGAFGTTDVADHATTTLSLASGKTNVHADDQVVVGDVTYVFKASVTTTANQVKIGDDIDGSLANLKAAINKSGGSGYGSATVANPDVFAGDIDTDNHVLKLHARTGGTGGNALDSTTTSVDVEYPGATFNSGTPGTASTGLETIVWTPTHPGTFHARATDGTNTATATIQVWQGG